MRNKEEIAAAEKARIAALVAEHEPDGPPPTEGGVYERKAGVLEPRQPAPADTVAETGNEE